MYYLRLFAAIMVFLLGSALSGAFAQDSGRDQAGTTAPDDSRAVTQAEPAARAGHEGDDLSEKGRKSFVAAIGPDGVQYIEITAGEYYFDPAHIVVKVNVPVELRVKKEPGFVPHNIVVRAPDAGMNFDVGLKKETLPIRFTPTKTGSYEMFCDKRLLFFKSHRDKGMNGMIEVVE